MIILDRFEGNYAVIEIDGEIINVVKDLINECVREGDVLKLVDSIYYKDEEATKNRKQSMEYKLKNMWED